MNLSYLSKYESVILLLLAKQSKEISAADDKWKVLMAGFRCSTGITPNFNCAQKYAAIRTQAWKGGTNTFHWGCKSITIMRKKSESKSSIIPEKNIYVNFPKHLYWVPKSLRICGRQSEPKQAGREIACNTCKSYCKISVYVCLYLHQRKSRILFSS